MIFLLQIPSSVSEQWQTNNPEIKNDRYPKEWIQKLKLYYILRI